MPWIGPATFHSSSWITRSPPMAGKVSFTYFLCFGLPCKVTDKCNFSYRKRNDEKTPGKLSDTNDEADSSGNRVKKFRTKKPCWSSDPQQENQQQGEEINRHRRGKGSIAKSLHYGIMESSSDEAQSIPLYRLVAAHLLLMWTSLM